MSLKTVLGDIVTKCHLTAYARLLPITINYIIPVFQESRQAA